MARRTAESTRRRVRRIAGFAGFLGAVWLTGFVWFTEHLPERVDAPERVTDAIVVLTGGSQRVGTGLDLLAAGLAERLLISGVHRDVDLNAVLRANGRDHDAAACCVDLGHSARTTRGNAAEAADWAARHGVRSLRLVTAAYHIPRSLLVFRHRLPAVRIVSHPVFPAGADPAGWWRRPATARLLMTEYNKYLAALAREKLYALTKETGR